MFEAVLSCFRNYGLTLSHWALAVLSVAVSSIQKVLEKKPLCFIFKNNLITDH